MQFLLGILGFLRYVFKLPGRLISWYESSDPEKKAFLMRAAIAILLCLVVAVVWAMVKLQVDREIKAAYDKGYATAVSEQQVERKKELTALQSTADEKQKKIQDTADASAVSAQNTIVDLSTRLSANEDKLKQIRASLNTTVYDAKGNVLICYVHAKGNRQVSDTTDTPAEVSELHLGTDFSDMWNQINDTANQTIKEK